MMKFIQVCSGCLLYTSRQSKTNIIVFTSLVCRAAIEGGLSPEEAYALGDSYIQSAENAKTLDDLEPVSYTHLRKAHSIRRKHLPCRKTYGRAGAVFDKLEFWQEKSSQS